MNRKRIARTDRRSDSYIPALNFVRGDIIAPTKGYYNNS
jgi:hypothetical protein